MTHAPSPQPRVRLVTRHGCHLCDEARVVVAEECERAAVGWSEADVDADPALRAECSELVPVVEVDGRRHDVLRIDRERLRRRLEVAASRGPVW